MLELKRNLLILIACALSSGIALAKLPPPSDEAKAKADEAKAKAAHGALVAAYQLCKSEEKVAERYLKGKGAKPAASTCKDPGLMASAASAPAAPAPAKKN